MLSTAGIQRSLRIRQLAGDARAGVRVRAVARRRQYAFLRRVWRPYAVIMLVSLAFFALIAYLEPSQFMKGVTIGGGTVATLAALLMMAQQATGTGHTSMGALAEQWTAGELRSLRKAGGRIVNHLALERGDIDHAVIAPSGVYAVESKWSASGWDLGSPSDRLDAALNQVRRNARQLRLWQPMATARVMTVRPVLFLWGGTEVTKPDRPTRIGDVDIVYGIKAARVWRAAVADGFGAPRITDPTIDALWQAINLQASRRDAYDARHEPAPRSPAWLVGQVLAVLLISPVAFLGCLYAYPLTHSVPYFVAAAGASVALGWLAARRIAALRFAGAAWSAGSGIGLAFVLAIDAYLSLR